MKLVIQPAQPLDLNMNDPGLFPSMKEYRAWRKGYGPVDEMAAGVPAMFADCDNETLEGDCRGLSERHSLMQRE